MKIKFKTNLGLLDAQKFGLDFTACRAGDEAEVSEAAAKELCLIAADLVIEAVAKPAAIEAPAKRKAKHD